jgi:elongation factor P
MYSTADFKKGLRIELEGEPYSIIDTSMHVSAGRGGNTLVKTRLRNIKTGQLVDRQFKNGDRVKIPDFEIRDAQYLYEEGGETYYFMDLESYEQFPLQRSDIEYELGFVRTNDNVRALVFNGVCIGIEVPNTVELVVADTAPGFKGDTVTGATKEARMDTGLVLQVPMFVEIGQVLVIDTRDSRYIRRA